MSFETILYEEDGPIGWITLNRPEGGNMFNETMCHELRDCMNDIRRETRTRVVVLTGSGDRFFCIGGEKSGMEDTLLYPGVLPTLEIYESIERLQVVCDMTIAKDSAVFRQVGPMMGSFDAGYGTWRLEDLVGTKRAKEMWMLNDRLSAAEAKERGLINRVVPDSDLREETRKMAMDVAERGPFALAAIKHAFLARHGGVAGLSRVTHDLLLRPFLETNESKELGASFREKRKPDPDTFGQ